ncbi:MAG: FAD-binding protein [Abditibacteriales bacterium]|nr:FAD-binding protein [Abditibacteriales bacterium]MDW8365076.1 FAD-linked oxidase C-terminal domain-containing protein [Abditibacteriales bacterium]
MKRDELVRALERIVGADGVIADREDLATYECDALVVAKGLPNLVVLPRSTEEVVEVVKWANRAGVPFVPRGAGTGLSGGTLAEGNAIVIALTRMNRLLAVDIPNRVALVEAGVVNLWISQAVAPHGLFYAPDPSSQIACTIGGNIANNSGGPHTLKYGVTTNHVLGVEFVTPEGEVVTLGGKVPDMPGYDLVGMVVGSEGTFGIVTKAWVRLLHLPEHYKTLLAVFDHFADATDAISAIIASGVIPAALEMIDQLCLTAVEAAYHFGFPLDAEAVLIVEMDGLKEDVEIHAARAAELCWQHGAREVRVAQDEKQRLALWKARKGAFGALGRIARSYLTQDGVVPRSQLTHIMRRVQEIAQQFDVRIANVLHAGDGNLHPCVLFDERNPDETRRAIEAGFEILRACVDAGGSITGEHGIGIEKLDLMEYAFTRETLKAMATLHDVFNTNSLCNPGKSLPSGNGRGCQEVSLLRRMVAV